MADALAPIADKLKALIRMLSSDRDGEIVNAARALNRLLKTNGCDIHFIADGVANGKKFTEADATEIYRRGVADGKRQAERKQDIRFHSVDDHDEPTWHEIACECRQRPDQLNGDREKKFVDEMVRRIVRGGEPSERQADWLRKIYARVR